MISKYTYKKLTWIDVEKPSREEISYLKEEYNIPVLISEEMLVESVRAKVDVHEDLIFMIMHFPTGTPNVNKRGIEQEIDFVVGHNFVITVHYEPIESLVNFSKQFSEGSKLERGKPIPHAGFLLHFIVKELYKKVAESLEDMNGWLKEIEQNIFTGREEKMVQVISNVNKNILDYKQTLRFHKETLHSFQMAAKDFFNPDFTYELSTMIGEYNKVQHTLDGHKEILNDLRDTNNSLLSTKTNDTMKKLTIMTFIMLPLTLITGIFGMNMDMIFIKSIEHFLLVVLGMTIIAVIMFTYFKVKKWF